MKDGVQIALVKKMHLSIMEQNNYVIEFEEDAVNRDYVLILLFVAFIDNVYFPNNFRIDAIKYEKTIGMDKYKNRTLWKSRYQCDSVDGELGD